MIAAGPVFPASVPAQAREATRQHRDDRQATLLILITWSTIVVPRIVQSATSPKYRTTVGAPVPLSAPATYVYLALFVLLVGFSLVVLFQRLGCLPVTRRCELLLLLAPWMYLLSRDLYLDNRPERGAFIYPLVVVTLWLLRPRLDRLVALGYLSGLTSLVSLALGVFAPSKGIYTSATGDLISPEKRILPGGLLIGLFTDSNNLGQFLVLGLPAIGLIGRRAVRLSLLAATAYAIVWTSSRSSIGAMVGAAIVVTVMAALHGPGRAVARRAFSVLVATVGVVVLAALPILTRSDTAFTNRGAIWIAGLQAWSQSPVVGWGSAYYSELAKYANPLGGLAFHGHNQFVQTMVTGGLVSAVLVGAMGVAVALAAARWAGRNRPFPTVQLMTFLVSCSFEVSFGLVDREFLAPVAILPIAFWVFATTGAEEVTTALTGQVQVERTGELAA